MVMTLTPEQFNKLVTKDDLDEKLGNFYTKSEMDKRFDQVLTATDAVMKKTRQY
jgi:hypothetical protein